MHRHPDDQFNPDWQTLDETRWPISLAQQARRFPSLLAGDSAFFAGDLSGVDRLNHAAIGVVGTRRPTAYGQRFLNAWLDLQAAERFAGVIISGGALGIDGLVHQGALERGLATHAVLVGPRATPNPGAHLRLFRRLAATSGCGVWVPESLEPLAGRSPKSHWWLHRNQWLAAMAKVLIVVEAGNYSGTWYTVKVAQKFGIPVFALPGAFDSPVSLGTNAMITRGYAHPITSVAELQKSLVVELGTSPYNKSMGSERGSILCPTQLSLRPEPDGKLLKLIRIWLRRPGGIGLSELVHLGLEAGLTVADLNRTLREMSERGEVSVLGDRFEGRR